MTATERTRFFVGEHPRRPTAERLQYRAFTSDRLSIYRLPTTWLVVNPHAPVGERGIRRDTYAEAVECARMILAGHRPRTGHYEPTWTSEYEPDYSTAEHPPVEHVRALLQAAWA